MKKPRRARPNATGRNDVVRYFTISYPLAQSAAWRSLSGPAAKVWIELRTRYNGGNNGKLALSLDGAAGLLGLGKATVARAFQELERKGFVEMKRRGRWYGRQATEWAVTTEAVDGHLATHAWKRWQPSAADALGSQADRKSRTRFPSGPQIGNDGSASEPIHSPPVRPGTCQDGPAHILRSVPEPLIETMGSGAPGAQALMCESDARAPIGLPESFARDLRQRRAAAGISQRDLAKWSGISQPFIANVERERYRPSAESWARLALALDTAQGALAA